MLVLGTETSLANTFAKHINWSCSSELVFSSRAAAREAGTRHCAMKCQDTGLFDGTSSLVFNGLMLSQSKRECRRLCINLVYRFHFMILLWKSSGVP